MDEDYTIEDLLFNEKPMSALITIKEHQEQSREPISKADLHRAIDSTYAHTCKLIEKMDDLGLVREAAHSGREVPVELTDKGHKVAYALREAKREIEGAIEDEKPSQMPVK